MDYANGQVYAIRSHLTDQIYIGSTAQPLHKRLYQHKMNSNTCTSVEIIKHGDAYIELIENFPCQSKKELNRREGQHIRNTENCVNKNIAGRTPQESCAQYYVTHRAEKLQKQKIYDLAHRAEKLEKQKEHYAAHRAELCEYQKKYRLAHQAELSAQRKQKYAAKKRGETPRAPPTENGGQGACPLSQSAPSSEA
jgi:hypothetical protein